MERLRRRLSSRAAAGAPRPGAEAGQREHRPTAARRWWQALRGCFCFGRRCQRSSTLSYWETDDLVANVNWLTREESRVSVASRVRFYIGSEASSLDSLESNAGAGGCRACEEPKDSVPPRVIFYIGSETSSLDSWESNVGAGGCLDCQEPEETMPPRVIFYIGSGTSSLGSSESAGGAEDWAACELPQDTVAPRVTFYIGSETSSLDSW